ncbi:MAG: exodeoxyribonuclease III [Rhizobiales bacterium 63-7]|uniref:exodeoxyribonuclease III n=1 Tax=Rhizobium sp. YJ-22 TaxID=3037556 RepID=UPI0009279415|nr:exodeoxyribonuclease III [Rhizobium sp. YJ-22]MBN9029424.1 exodeoxyribonuclease III [Hyphomicrobiales bacterium]MDG3577561.1 exodeoxyribonuclease III [Rhizobium sp. YJ-22]OJU71342.1 MAG: exodeoxyribonuclease III [Rhizobiales bacterium 63-7]
MTFSITTWNINSVRLRMPIVQQFVLKHRPDILCLQETKVANELFPYAPLRAMGFEHVIIHGQKGYHGVAIASRLPLTEDHRQDYCGVGDSRHISAVFERGGRRVRLHNFYVPAGGDEPDRTINPKFGHKLDFIEEMKRLKSTAEANTASILVGDLNIAPLEHDVWSHKQLLKIVSHTPVETEGLLEVMRLGGWEDLMRRHVPASEKLYTWWSYRAKDWAAADRGRRLDHIWSSPDLAPLLKRIEIFKEARGWEQPSDHVPVTAHFDL